MALPPVMLLQRFSDLKERGLDNLSPKCRGIRSISETATACLVFDILWKCYHPAVLWIFRLLALLGGAQQLFC